MRRVYLLALAIVLLCRPLGAAHAQVFVSNNGTDSGTCGDASTPCRTLATAVSHAASDAEVRCLDALESGGGAQNVTIGISITIDCRGAYSGVTLGNINNDEIGFIVDAPGINVTFRGLNFFSLPVAVGTGKVGIDIRQAASVTIQDCTFRLLSAEGVYDHRSTAGKLLIKDTVIQQVSGPAIAVAGAARNAAIIDNVTLDSNLDGVTVAAFNKATITHSSITNNTGNGVQGDANAFVIVDGSTISSNASGIVSTSSVRLSNNNIAFNNRAIGGASGTYGNNRFSGNTTIGTTPTPLGGASSDVAQQ